MLFAFIRWLFQPPKKGRGASQSTPAGDLAALIMALALLSLLGQCDG